MRETGMVIECRSRKHKFLLGLTDDGYRRECPSCSDELLQPREAFSANEIYGMKTIGRAWRDKRKANKVARVNCVHLTSKQIDMIRFFIGNYDKHNMPICSCDITRVLELGDG